MAVGDEPGSCYGPSAPIATSRRGLTTRYCNFVEDLGLAAWGLVLQTRMQ